jgi:hypothetical protein
LLPEELQEHEEFLQNHQCYHFPSSFLTRLFTTQNFLSKLISPSENIKKLLKIFTTSIPISQNQNINIAINLISIEALVSPQAINSIAIH